MWIENVAAIDVSVGFHHDPGPNSMLIQIGESGWFPTPKYPFAEAHKFLFSDVEKDDDHVEELGISEQQAKDIAALLVKAKDDKMNIVVHCQAGICRSGAVVEAAVVIGFEDTGKYRQPNLLVKHSLFKALGLSYDLNELPDLESWRNYNFTDSGPREDGGI